eukprot:COSAG05_NODE_5315_length_1208_cov_2.402164_1_plen_71_part_00
MIILAEWISMDLYCANPTLLLTVRRVYSILVAVSLAKWRGRESGTWNMECLEVVAVGLSKTCILFLLNIY